MITIDGSAGEGGGQILRTALGLSLVTGEAFSIERIRAGRSKPGLLRQHLTAVEAARVIGNARVDGNVIGSQQLYFHPGKVVPGKYSFSVGTAGSATLVFQTILPALMMADAPSTVIIEGGTHNPYAPSFDFLKAVFAPVLKRMGIGLELTLHRHGFYPAGGGKFEARIAPAVVLKHMSILERGTLNNLKAKAIFAQIPGNIAVREIAVARKQLSLAAEDAEIFQVMDSQGPGNVFSVEVNSEYVTEMFIGFGQLRVRAEAVAQGAVDQVNAYLKADVPVGPYLADQLLIPLALSQGGQFMSSAPSPHALTNAAIIENFLNVRINCKEVTQGQWLVSAAPTS